MGKELTGKGQHKDANRTIIWVVIKLYLDGGSSYTDYAFVQTHRTMHQKE